MNRILMFGPPQGHNIKLYLDYFKRKKTHRVTYCYAGKTKHNFDDFELVNHYNYQLKFWRFLKNIVTGFSSYDVIWIHNWTRLIAIIPILIFKRKKVKVLFSVWSDPVPMMALKGGFKGKLYRYVFRKSSKVHTLWWGNYEMVKEAVPTANVEMIPWGLSPEYFESLPTKPQSEFTKNFVASLPLDKVKFFWPKSISYASAHDLVVEASKILVEKDSHNFVVYFWLGNAVKQELKAQFDKMIEDYNLSEHVKFVDHEFLPFEDVIYIWNKMDAGLQIAKHDALSTSLLEPLFFGKEIVVSDIAPYKFLNSKLGINLKLTPLNALEIANEMKLILEGKLTSNEDKVKRKLLVESNFNFESNIQKQIESVFSS